MSNIPDNDLNAYHRFIESRWAWSLPYEPGHAKICLMPYVIIKGTDQPARPRSLISAFVVRSLDSIISLLSRSEISRF